MGIESFAGSAKSIFTSDIAKQAFKEVGKFGAEHLERKVGEMIENKSKGLEREKAVRLDLKKMYPDSKIISEAYLRDKEGHILKDPITNTACRIDFIVIKGNKVIDSIEVTSKTAEKENQIAKENRIRAEGGNYIKADRGMLVRIPSTVTTKIERRD